MEKERTVLFISWGSGDALRAAQRLNLRVVLATDRALTWQRQYVDELIAIDPYDRQAVLEAIGESARRSIHGVVTFDERAVPTAAIAAETLGLPGNTFDAAYAARNKFLMRSRFAEQGLPCPRFGIAETLDEAKKLASDNIGFPLVVKPLFGFASQGVIRVDSQQQLEEAYPKIKLITESHKAFVKDDRYEDYLILEEFMSGREVAVDAILERGQAQWIGIFDKPEPLEGPTFEETIYVTPSSEPDDLQADIFEVVQRGAQALGLSNGPLHAEVRITTDGLRIIEIGARAIGGVCARAYNYCLGFDYSELILRNALGEQLRPQRGKRIPSGVMMIPVPNTGRLASVKGVEEAQRVSGIRDVFIMAKPGDVIRSYPEQGCYIGFILATGLDTAEVAQRLNESHSFLHFELEPLGD